MKKYEKPCLEIIELRPEERLAAPYELNNKYENDDWIFTVDDKAGDLKVDMFTFSSKKGLGGGFLKDQAMDFIKNFIRGLGFYVK